MRITVHDGAGVIGGTKVLLEDAGTAVFLDFGINFAQKGLYFEEFLQPRATRGLLDLLETSVIPRLKGLYRPDLEPLGLWERFSPAVIEKIDGVLLTHAHLDHSGHISLLRDDIPIFMRLLTAVMVKAIQDSGQAGFEREVCYITPRVPDGDILRAGGEALLRPLRIVGEDPARVKKSLAGVEEFFRQIPMKSKGLGVRPLEDADSVGGLPVRVFPVDHSIFGASAYAMETSSGWAVYTGDLRRHGKRKDLTEAFVNKASTLKPRVLLVEGTNTEFSEPVPEEAVGQKCLGAISRAEGLVIADFGPRNLERLLMFYGISRECGRSLVVNAQDAYLIDALAPLIPEVRETVSGDGLRVYRKDRAGKKGWEEVVYAAHEARCVTKEDISGDPGAFILCFSFWDFNELIDINPKGGSYIYSTSEAFDEEQKIDIQRWKQWLDHFHMKVFGFPDIKTGKVRPEGKGFHASGHMAGKDILWLIEAIDPEIVIPVHTEEPGFFLKHLKGKRVIVPEKGVPIEF